MRAALPRALPSKKSPKRICRVGSIGPIAGTPWDCAVPLLAVASGDRIQIIAHAREDDDADDSVGASQPEISAGDDAAAANGDAAGNGGDAAWRPASRVVVTLQHTCAVTSLAWAPGGAGSIANFSTGGAAGAGGRDDAAGAASSPTVLAVGDRRGQIHFYDLSSAGGQAQGQSQTQGQTGSSSSSSSSLAPFSMLHWHAHAVTSLTYAPDGVHLLSGGEEAVLVLWQLSTGHRQYLPRLGGPIVHVATSGDGTRYACATADNAVRVVEARSMSVVATVRGLGRDPRCGIYGRDAAESGYVRAERKKKCICIVWGA